jgi:hypothetical protein
MAVAFVYVGLFVMAACFVAGELAMNRVVDAEFIRHRHRWETDGRPSGGRVTREHITWKSDISRVHCGLQWLFAQPQWLQSDPEARKWFRCVRVLLGGMFAGIALLLVAAFSI